MLLSGSTLAGWPQDLDKGKAEFLAYCASCHGADASGASVKAAELRARPADLTTIAKRNRGVFDADSVYKAIIREGAASRHLSDEMPNWQCRHEQQIPMRKRVRGRLVPPLAKKKLHAPAAESLLDLPCDPEMVIKERLLSIVNYLAKIQIK